MLYVKTIKNRSIILVDMSKGTSSPVELYYRKILIVISSVFISCFFCLNYESSLGTDNVAVLVK